MELPAPLTPDNWQQHPFVRYLPVEHLAILNECAMVVQFDIGQTIFREGDPANRFYLILNGAVALQSHTVEGGATLTVTLGEGDVLGWSWLFPPYRWHFDAVAVESTQAVFFYGTWLRQMTEEHHELGYELMRRMAEVLIRRLQATRRQMMFGPESGNLNKDNPRLRERRLRD